MCDPVTAMVVLTTATTAMSVKQQGDQASFQKGTARYNQRVAENEAQRTRGLATEKENIQRQKNAQLLSKQRAQLAASNVELTSGSALQLQEDTQTLGEIDALRIRRGGDEQFAALNRDADLQGAKADFAGTAGRNAQIGSILGGAASIAGTGVADKWFTSKSAGSMNLGLNNVNLNATPSSPTF